MHWCGRGFPSSLPPLFGTIRTCAVGAVKRGRCWSLPGPMCYQVSPSVDGDSLLHSNLITWTTPFYLINKSKVKLQITPYHCCFQRLKSTNIKWMCECQRTTEKILYERIKGLWAVVKSTGRNYGVLGYSSTVATDSCELVLFTPLVCLSDDSTFSV